MDSGVVLYVFAGWVILGLVVGIVYGHWVKHGE